MADRTHWFTISMLFLAGGISYLDRAAMSVAAPLVARDFGLSPTQLGIVFSSFFVGYAPMCFLGGLAADRFGGRRIFLVAMAVWSVSCGLTATVATMPVLLLVRAVFGMGEGPYNATTVKMISESFAPSRRASVIGLTYTGQPLGAALAGPLIGSLTLLAGWRVSFVVIAALGLLWVAAWKFAAPHRPRAAATQAAGAPALYGRPPPSLRSYLAQPTVLAIALAFFAYGYVLYFFLSWFPSYLVDSQHLSLARMGIISILPWTAGAAGMALGGVVCDLVYHRIGDALVARKSVLVVCLVVTSACVSLISFSQNLATIVTLMTTGIFFLYATASIYYAVILDTVADTAVGSVSGFINFSANVAGLVAPSMTGLLVGRTGSYDVAFILAGAVALIGASAILIFVRYPGKPIVQDRSMT